MRLIHLWTAANTSPAPVAFTLNSSLPLHVCDVPVDVCDVPVNLLCHNHHKVSPPINISPNLTAIFRSHAVMKKFQQLMIAPRVSAFYGYNYEYKGVSLQPSFSMLITLLLHVILDFMSTKMILVFNIFSIFNLNTFTYMKCYINLSRNLTNYINQHKDFLLRFFNCFHLCQVIKIAWIIIGKKFALTTKLIFLVGLISVKYLQSTKFQVKCYRCCLDNCLRGNSPRIIAPWKFLHGWLPPR